jgi:cytochrome c peroxidase
MSRNQWLASCLLTVIFFAAVGSAIDLRVATAQRSPEPLAALPRMPVPADQPLTADRVKLGELLFFDPRLSGDGSISCADCHDPKLGWGDGNALSRGYPGTVHWRNSQTVVNSGYLKSFFWSSASPTLEHQANSAATGALAGNIQTRLGEERMKQIPLYVDLFERVYGARPSWERAMLAIAAYERTIVSDDSAFDRYMRGEPGALSAQQLRGKALFEGKAGCIACHNGALLTDGGHHNTGVPPNPEFITDPQRQIAMRERIRGKGIAEEVYLALDRDPGRYLETKKDEDKGKFRTAPLRYLVYTAPYMHNGVFLTLEEVVDFYDQGGGQDPFNTKSTLLRPLMLTAAEKQDLVAFLESLSGLEIKPTRPTLPSYGVLQFPMAPGQFKK